MNGQTARTIALALAGLISIAGCGEDTLTALQCEEGKEIEDGICVPICDPPFIYHEGECVCPEGYEERDGTCGEICDVANGFIPDGIGCVFRCDEGWLWDGATCVLDCPENTIQVGDVCECAPGFEMVQDVCRPECEPGTIRVGVDCLAVGGVEGRVCDFDLGVWIENVTVTITLADSTVLTATTDANGYFLIEEVPPGTYSVGFAGPGGYTNTLPVLVEAATTAYLGATTCEYVDPCPGATPVAEAGPDQTAVPDETVQLDGTGSTDPNGQGLTYEWRVAGQPTGSSSDLSDPASATPTMLADVSGDFSVCLTVIDVDECRSAEDCMSIAVAPQVAYHIELTWDADNSDVDLHYKQPTGNWFGMFGGDCYYATPSPDFGPGGMDFNSTNNPSLDVDNTAGFGPENINADVLYDDGPFAVGVHYYGGNGEVCYPITDQAACDANPICQTYTNPLGQLGCVGIPTAGVTARVRIYVDGTLQYEAFSDALECDDFWTVAEITVSGNGTAVSVNPVNTIEADNGHGVCP